MYGKWQSTQKRILSKRIDNSFKNEASSQAHQTPRAPAQTLGYLGPYLVGLQDLPEGSARFSTFQFAEAHTV